MRVLVRVRICVGVCVYKGQHLQFLCRLPQKFVEVFLGLKRNVMRSAFILSSICIELDMAFTRL